MFLPRQMEILPQIADEIVVSYGNRLFTGEYEKDDVVLQKYRNDPRLCDKVTWTCYDVSPGKPMIEYCCQSRWEAYRTLRRQVDWLLVMDSDEIMDVDRFREWWDQNQELLRNKDRIYRFMNYWYFKSSTYRARTWEESILMIPVSSTSPLERRHFFGSNDRHDLEKNLGLPIVHNIVHPTDHQPMFHHYSWVRESKEKLYKKLKTSAHCHEICECRDPWDVIQYIYRDTRPNDVVHGYQYDVVPSPFQ